MQIEVFVSCSRKDHLLAEAIDAKLVEAGLSVWRDQGEIPDSSPWFSREIQDAIREAQCVLVLWTRNSVIAQQVIAEATLAKVHGKLVQVRYGVGADSDHIYEFSLTHCTEIGDENLDEVVRVVREAIGIRGPMEHIIEASALGPSVNFRNPGFRYLVPGKELFLSFYPYGSSGVFLTMRFETTDGWITDQEWAREEVSNYIRKRTKEKNPLTSEIRLANQIYLIQDPLRPMSIQIGELRAMRPHPQSGAAGAVAGDWQLERLPLEIPWISMMLAEVMADPDSLLELSRAVENSSLDESVKQKVRAMIGSNPDAPADLQTEHCRFCNPAFTGMRRLSSPDDECRHGAFIIANDFPFAPCFHYLSITSAPVHSWISLSFTHLRGINLIIHSYLQDERHLRDADGISFGFNAPVRHLMHGKHHSRSSAGASIPHVHKQVWGMSAGTSNLASQLVEVCQAYENHGIDYQGNYMNALEEAGYMIWKDRHVMLYVPYGQSSQSEMQAMLIRPSGSYRDLDEKEVVSLSIAEYIALRIFRELGINCFNHVMLSKLFHDRRAPRFRQVELFITRDVDLAVSEISDLYVVDQHPWDSCKIIREKWEAIREEVLREVRQTEDSFC